MSREADYLVFVAKFILDSYELFHIESEQNMISAVDEFIERQRLK